MRRHNIAKEDRSKYVSFILLRFIIACWTIFFFLTGINLRLVSEALLKMKGKIHEIAGSHVSSRVLQVILTSYFLVYLYLSNLFV